MQTGSERFLESLQSTAKALAEFLSFCQCRLNGDVWGYIHVLTTLQWEPLSVANLICKECILPRRIAKSDRRYIIPDHFFVSTIWFYVCHPPVSWSVHRTFGSELGTQRDTTGERGYQSSGSLYLGHCVPSCWLSGLRRDRGGFHGLRLTLLAEMQTSHTKLQIRYYGNQPQRMWSWAQKEFVGQ